MNQTSFRPRGVSRLPPARRLARLASRREKWRRPRADALRRLAEYVMGDIRRDTKKMNYGRNFHSATASRQAVCPVRLLFVPHAARLLQAARRFHFCFPVSSSAIFQIYCIASLVGAAPGPPAAARGRAARPAAGDLAPPSCMRRRAPPPPPRIFKGQTHKRDHSGNLAGKTFFALCASCTN